jgi:class 3 adenylate cyclase
LRRDRRANAVEPRIQYAKTTDGVSIAFWTMGEGMPLVHTPFTFSHIQMEWQFPEMRRWYERLAEKRKLIRYDVRGAGLSDGDIGAARDTLLLDIDALADRLRVERFALMGAAHYGPVAIAYAAEHPERVSHLILWAAYARPSDWTQSSTVQAVRALIDKDWTFYTEAAAHALLGWSEGEPARRYAALIRESTTQEGMRRSIAAASKFDVADLLSQVMSPTLVFHRRQLPVPSVEVARGLASHIPDARLVLLEGESPPPYLGDSEAVLAAIDEFLGQGEEAAPAAELPEGMAVLLFADIAESTALTEQLGDAAFRAKARELDTSLRSTIRDSGGTPVEGKVLGDGVLAVFTSARQAIECALRCEAVGEPLGLKLHLGIHAGDVIREGNNVYGGAVNIAARIAAASAPGEVLVSDTVRSLGRTSADVTFDDRGEHELKGVGEPQRLFAVR